MYADQRMKPLGSVRPVWMWWHLLGLDAPTIAVLWAHLFARAAQVRLSWGEHALLAGAVWLTYTADRVLDSALVTDPARLRPRHHFARRQRRRLAIICLPTLLAVVALAQFGIDRALFHAGLRLLALVLIYLCAVHLGPATIAAEWVKRAAVGIIFSLGTVLPAWMHTGVPTVLVLPAVAFAFLCFLNCTAIETWEDDRQHGTFGLVVAAGACALVLITASPLITAGRVALFACATSALGLSLLDATRDRLSVDAVRVLADAALLTAMVSFRPA
jgi:hypothetical protein